MKSRKIYRRKSKINKYRLKKQKTKKRRLVKRKRKKRVSRIKKGGLLPDRARCCNAEYVKFVKAHGGTTTMMIDDGSGGIGSILPERIIIPRNTYVITLGEPGVPSILNSHIDKTIRDFYTQGNTLFEDNDKLKKLTPEGEGFQSVFNRELGQGEIYKFKNHIPGMSMNNIDLNFIKGSGHTCDDNSCSIDCFDLKSKKWIKNCRPKNRDRLDSTDRIETKLSDLLEDQGEGVYIIRACRDFENFGEPQVEKQFRKVAREISSDAGITPEQYEIEKELSEDYFTEYQAPPYGTPVTTTKLTSTKYNNRSGTVVKPTERLKPGRVAVLLDGDKKPISLKRTNIIY